MDEWEDEENPLAGVDPVLGSANCLLEQGGNVLGAGVDARHGADWGVIVSGTTLVGKKAAVIVLATLQ